MGKNAPRLEPPAVIAALLAAHPDVRRSLRPAGQVLVYCGHVPLSVFVVLSGAVRVEHPAPGRWAEVHRATAERPILTPAPDAIGQTALATIVLAEDSEVLFVPRSLVTSDPGIVAALAEPAFWTLSLRVERT